MKRRKKNTASADKSATPERGASQSASHKAPSEPTPPRQTSPPKPPTPLRLVSYRPPEPINVPSSLPDGWPARAELTTRGLIREAVSGLNRAQIAAACEAVVAKCKCVLLDEIAAARRKPIEAHDLMLELVKYLLIENYRWGRWGDEGLGLQTELRRSKEWCEFEKELAECEARALALRLDSEQGTCPQTAELPDHQQQADKKKAIQASAPTKAKAVEYGAQGGRPRKDEEREMIRKKRDAGKSWKQVTGEMDTETGNQRTVSAYRYLLSTESPQKKREDC